MKTKMPTEASTIVSLKSQGKDTHFLSKKTIFFDYLQHHTATASMVTDATGIVQKNICRFKRDYEKMNLLWEVDYKPCDITGCMASWLSTNPDIVPNIFDTQLSLFEEGGGES